MNFNDFQGGIMKKFVKLAIAAILSLCATTSAFACSPNDIECEHDWAIVKSTQIKTVYECSKCSDTKEDKLEFGVNYMYTATEIIVPETLSTEELNRTLPSAVSTPVEVRETMEQIGTIDTVEKYKIVLNKYIETGNLNYSETVDGGTIRVNVEKICDGMSLADNGETYLLMIINENVETNGEIAKSEDSNVLFEATQGRQKLYFSGGKIQYKVTYLNDIEIIFNYEIL